MFRNAKVGDRVWDFSKGWGTVLNITLSENYPIFVKFDNSNRADETYTYEGKANNSNVNPTLFWDEIHFSIPKKPFNLKEFLKENLEPKEFVFNESNYYLYWQNSKQKIDYGYNIDYEDFKAHFKETNIVTVVETLNDNKITKKQLKQAFKELGWI